MSGRVSDIIFGDHHDRRTGGEAEEIEENILYEDEIPSEASGQVSHILSSPARIYEYLDSKVYGQKDAKRAAAMLLWNHVNGRRQNVLFAGPTGCGKTEIFRQLAKLYPNIVIHKCHLAYRYGLEGQYQGQKPV